MILFPSYRGKETMQTLTSDQVRPLDCIIRLAELERLS